MKRPIVLVGSAVQADSDATRLAGMSNRHLRSLPLPVHATGTTASSAV